MAKVLIQDRIFISLILILSQVSYAESILTKIILKAVDLVLIALKHYGEIAGIVGLYMIRMVMKYQENAIKGSYAKNAFRTRFDRGKGSTG